MYFYLQRLCYGIRYFNTYTTILFLIFNRSAVILLMLKMTLTVVFENITCKNKLYLKCIQLRFLQYDKFRKIYYVGMLIA